ncbi:MAG: glycosyltransferase family 2 protein [Cyanobacteria bacterium J06621_11]
MLNISVVIPAYNCQQYVAEAIESAIAQSPLEVIVIDDGSTDDTQAVVEQIDHANLRYVYQHNQGVSAARNHGFYIAKGELIAFLDADDYFLPTKLTQQREMFAKDSSLGLVQSGWQRVDEQGNMLSPVRLWESVPKLSTENWLKFKPVLPSALMVKREWLLKVDGFDPQLKAAEDVDLVSRLAVQGCQSDWLRDIGVSYRQRSNSAMGNALVQAQDLSKFLDKFFQLSELPESIRMLEASVRYNTLVWAAWYLLHTGHKKEMADYLKVAWQHSPYLPLEAIIHWAESFSGFSKELGEPLEIVDLISSDEWQQLVRWLLSQKSCFLTSGA